MSSEETVERWSLKQENMQTRRQVNGGNVANKEIDARRY